MEDTSVSVAAVEDVGPDTVTIEFQTPAEFEARPGQFVKLLVDLDGETESRFYTISSPDVEDTFTVTVGVDPEGAVGPVLATLEPGDPLSMSGPYGNAFYEDESSVVVLAGGPGVGAAIGIARRALADGASAAVVYRDDVHVHQADLASLEADGARIHVLDAEESLTPAVRSTLADGGDEQLFIYGFAEFLDDATDAIEAAGGTPDEAKVENFG